MRNILWATALLTIIHCEAAAQLIDRIGVDAGLAANSFNTVQKQGYTREEWGEYLALFLGIHGRSSVPGVRGLELRIGIGGGVEFISLVPEIPVRETGIATDSITGNYTIGLFSRTRSQLKIPVEFSYALLNSRYMNIRGVIGMEGRFAISDMEDMVQVYSKYSLDEQGGTEYNDPELDKRIAEHYSGIVRGFSLAAIAGIELFAGRDAGQFGIGLQYCPLIMNPLDLQFTNALSFRAYLFGSYPLD